MFFSYPPDAQKTDIERNSGIINDETKNREITNMKV